MIYGKREIKFKTVNRKQFILLLLIGYVVAYLINDGIENYTVKNQYEKNKIENYKEWK